MQSAIGNLRQALRARRRSSNPVVRYGIRSIDSARRFVLFFTSAAYRSIVLARLFRSDALHQTTVLTWMDRYPRIFSTCRDYFAIGGGEARPHRSADALNILSFGCSTGEEVMTLRQYFPAARIVGADINKRNLALCRQRAVDDRIAFVDSDREAIRAHAPFDAIFCMAVLQRTPHRIKDEGITNLGRIYPFEKFDRQIQELDDYLKTDGLLVIHHSQYLFSDSSVAERYRSLGKGDQELDDTVTFDRNSRRMDHVADAGSIFVKRAGRRVTP